jgi:Tfp pilus assembly protein PilF
MSGRRHTGIALAVASGAGALLFAVHPLRVEPVTWISDRKDLLCAFFVLLSILAALLEMQGRTMGTGRKWRFASLIFFGCALLSKPVAVVVPAVLALLESTPGPRTGWRSILRSIMPYGLLALVYGIVCIASVNEGGTLAMVSRRPFGDLLLLPPYDAAFYLAKTVWPTHLTPTYDIPPRAMLIVGAGMTIAVTAVAVWLAFRQRRGLLVAWGVYILFLLPTVVGLPAGIQPLADRYAYLPMMALYAALAWLFARLLQWAGDTGKVRLTVVAVGVAGGASLLVLSVTLARAQIGPWTDSDALWRHAVAVAPQMSKPYNNLGVLMLERGKTVEAVRFFGDALARDSMFDKALCNMGLALEAGGDTTRAETLFRRAAEVNPRYVDAYTNMGRRMLGRGDYAGASAAYEKAASIDPSSPKAHYNLGLAYYKLGRRGDAIRMFTRTLELQPENAYAMLNIAVIRREGGDTLGWRTALEEAARNGSERARDILRAEGRRGE